MPKNEEIVLFDIQQLLFSCRKLKKITRIFNQKQFSHKNRKQNHSQKRDNTAFRFHN